MKIYMIATIKDIESKFSAKMNGNFGLAEVFGTRTIGYATSLDEAKKWVENNSGDMHEDCYKFAVIEDIAPGIYSSTESTSTWYKWSNSQDKYLPIDKPAQVRDFVSFTLG
jgi:hypothetical protein